MSDKSGLNVATGFQGGVTVGINADSWSEFLDLCRDVYGEDGQEVAEGLYGKLKAQGLASSDAVAAAVVQQLGGVPAGARPGQSDPWATATPAQQYTAPVAAGGPPPGQTHDPRDPSKTKWVPAGISKKTQKPYVGFWSTP